MRDYIVIFILDAAGMILELVASRLMSPYFGNSNFVWTAVIGIILLAGSLGNLIGGRLAARKEARFCTTMLLLFAAIYIAVTPLVGAPILESIRNTGAGIQVAAVVGSIIFFLIPSTTLGIVPPIVMKERIGEGENKARESGRITAVIALGSLVGTFAGGFWLIPALGTKMIFVLIATMIILMVPLFRPLENIRARVAKIGLFVASVIAVVVTAVAFANVNDGNLGSSDSISIDTEYGRTIIEDGTYEGQEVRFYRQSGAYSSATFLNEDKKFDLVFDYLKKYDEMFEFLDVKNVAMIGGAAYQYPKYFISHFPDKSMDVIEIDPMATEIARKYFYLDDLIDEYGADRLGLYNDDGRVFLSAEGKKYDAILNDAFSGEVPVGTLATIEAAQIFKNRLNEGGVYMSNVLGAVDGDRGRFLRSEVETLKQVFKHVYVLPTHEQELEDFSNWMVVATDNDKYTPKTAVKVETDGNEMVLTDDYCPIESMVGVDYFE